MRDTNPSLLVIGMNFAPENTGVGPYTGRLTAGLASESLNVRVITTFPHYPQWKLNKDSSTFVDMPGFELVDVTRLPHYVPRTPKGFKRLLSELSFGFRVVLSKWRKPEAVLLVSPALISSAIALFRLRVYSKKTPVIVWVQDIYSRGLRETNNPSRVAHFILFHVEAWLLRSADSVVVIHERFRHVISQDFGIPLNKIEVIRNWTHIEQVNDSNRESMRHKYGWLPIETVVLHTGNMGVKQGLENVIATARRAESEAPWLRFVLVGDGSERARIQNLSTSLKNMNFHDPVTQSEYPSLLDCADILLVNELPGISQMALPSKLTSYFKAGKPVVAASDFESNTAYEIAASEGGLLIQSGNPDSLLQALMRVGDDPVFAAKLGRNGRMWCEEMLSEESALEKFRLLVARVLSEASKPKR